MLPIWITKKELRSEELLISIIMSKNTEMAAVPEGISARTLADMERAVSNFKRGEVSPAIDLSDF